MFPSMRQFGPLFDGGWELGKNFLSALGFEPSTFQLLDKLETESLITCWDQFHPSKRFFVVTTDAMAMPQHMCRARHPISKTSRAGTGLGSGWKVRTWLRELKVYMITLAYETQSSGRPDEAYKFNWLGLKPSPRHFWGPRTRPEL